MWSMDCIEYTDEITIDVHGVDAEITDESFDYSYGSINGIHHAEGLEITDVDYTAERYDEETDEFFPVEVPKDDVIAYLEKHYGDSIAAEVQRINEESKAEAQYDAMMSARYDY